MSETAGAVERQGRTLRTRYTVQGAHNELLENLMTQAGLAADEKARNALRLRIGALQAQHGKSAVGLYFGTTSGELWQSRDEGRQWECLARHLPEIYAVEVAYPR